MEPSYDLNVESEESPQSTVSAWLFCVVYCAFSFSFFIYALTAWREAFAILITGFFAAWGVVYLGVTIRQTLGQSKFGAVRLLLQRPLPAIGGRLQGSVSLPAAAMEANTVVAALTCYRESFTPGKDGGWSTDPIWCGKHSFPIRPKPEGGGSALIAIDVPASREPSQPRPAVVSASSAGPPKLFWKWDLRVTVDLPGVDLDRTYPITVLPAQPGAAPAAALVPAPEIRKEVAKPAIPKSIPQGIPKATEIESPDRSPLWVLVAANLVPIAGAFFWGWAVGDVVLLYWLENVVIGVFNLLRIMFAQPDQSEAAANGLEVTGGALLAGKAAFASFFLVHYGAFCLAHGGVLLSLFPGALHLGPLFGAEGVLHAREMLIALLAIIVSHGYSFFRNYLGRREYEGVNFAELMLRPYKRIFVTHIFILAGGFVLQAMKLPAVALVVFVAIKIWADAHFHRAEREALGARTTGA